MELEAEEAITIQNLEQEKHPHLNHLLCEAYLKTNMFLKVQVSIKFNVIIVTGMFLKV